METRPENRRLLNVIGLFRYLGLVESIGVSLLDMLVLLLVANGLDFHVERVHEVPRIVHGANFDDLQYVPLAAKIIFLERNDLDETSKFIDRELRNAVAHLRFKMDSEGKISIPTRKGKWKTVNIYERINSFNRKFMMITLIFFQEGLDKI